MPEALNNSLIYTGYVYIIYNNVNEKIYVGETIRNINRRFKEHLNSAFKECKLKNCHLYRAIRKYGPENFFIKEIDKVSGISKLEVKTELHRLEEYYIIKYDSLVNGYNSDSGGKSPKQVSEYTKLLLSLSKLNNINSNINLEKARDVSIKNRQKAVTCYNYDTGEFINKFNSIKEASLFYNIDSSGITKVCIGKVKYLGTLENVRLTWRYLDELYVPIYTIAAYDDNEELIEKFMTIKDAEIKLKINSSSIIKCCNGKVKHAGKYNEKRLKWKRLNNLDYAGSN